MVQSLLQNSISVRGIHTTKKKDEVYTSREQVGSKNCTDLNLPGARGLFRKVCMFFLHLCGCTAASSHSPLTCIWGWATPLRDEAVDDGWMEKWKGMMPASSKHPEWQHFTLSVEACTFQSVTGPEQFEALVYCWRGWVERARNNMGVTRSWPVMCFIRHARVCGNKSSSQI